MSGPRKGRSESRSSSSVMMTLASPFTANAQELVVLRTPASAYLLDDFHRLDTRRQSVEQGFSLDA
jgi:hypothetical protein